MRAVRCSQTEYLTELADYGKSRRRKYTDKDDKRYTVGYAVFRNSFTKPHNEHCARSVNYGKEYARHPQRRCLRNTAAFEVSEKRNLDGIALDTEVNDNTDSLRHRKRDGYVTGYLCNLLSAVFTLFGKTFQSGNTHSKKLNDNRSVDVGAYTEREQRCICKRTARDVGKYFKEGIVAVCYKIAESRYGYSGYGDITPEPENKQKKQSYPYLLSYFLDLKTVFYCFKHFEPLCLRY